MDTITIERETLLPCPFCGDDGDKGRQEVTQMIEGRNKFARITCRACGAMCPEENWNRRAALAAQPAEPSMRPLPDHDNHHNALKCPYCNPRGLKFAEPAAAQPANPEPVASYWLIECKNGFTGWYTNHRLDCRFFDTDPRKAYKFASKELAEKEISEHGHSCMTATEHVDIAAPPAPAAVPPGYALVPIKPTEAMEHAAEMAQTRHLVSDRKSGGHDPELSNAGIYRAMIAAAGDKT